MQAVLIVRTKCNAREDMNVFPGSNVLVSSRSFGQL